MRALLQRRRGSCTRRVRPADQLVTNLPFKTRHHTSFTWQQTGATSGLRDPGSLQQEQDLYLGRVHDLSKLIDAKSSQSDILVLIY